MKEVNAEIITIGDEILIGQIIDTNSQWISSELDLIGIKVNRKTSIRDEEKAILNELEDAFKRSNLILMTGGLGPTKDDITKKTIAKFFNVELQRNEDILSHVKSLFEKRGRKMNDFNLGQADIPSNCTPLMNYFGTAPGMWFENEGKILVSMPGIPLEMKKLVKNDVIPRLRKFFKTPIIKHKTIKTVGIGESDMMSLISDWEHSLPEHIKLAYLPRLGQVRLRLSGIGNNESMLETELNNWSDKLNNYIPKFIFGYENDEIEEIIGKKLASAKLTVATAESCTGGQVASKITSVSGSSAYFIGSVIAYSNDIKISELNVNFKDLEEQGAVSEVVVKQMAENIRLKFNTDIGLSTSGIAGPDGGTKEKPVGTVWIALSDKKGTIAKKLQIGLNREMNIELSTLSVLNLLRKRLMNWI
ncbi:competence/damage-inducible protein A [Hyphobacterium sp. CCMP332]|nr:competence/damage-inducible protein A [Hyphobacterium sp. CCMP332]